MSLDINTIERISFLSRLKITEEQKETLRYDLSSIIAFVEQLQSVDTTGVQPMTSVVEAFAPQREDIVTDGNYPDKVLVNAPDRVQNFYAVPKVVE